MTRALVILAALAALAGCATLAPQGEFWASDRWGKCAALSFSVGPARLSAHACVRLDSPDAGPSTMDSASTDAAE